MSRTPPVGRGFSSSLTGVVPETGRYVRVKEPVPLTLMTMPSPPGPLSMGFQSPTPKSRVYVHSLGDWMASPSGQAKSKVEVGAAM